MPISVATSASGKEWVKEAILAADETLVPDLYIAESSNTAWKFFHIEGASLEQIKQLAQRSMALPDSIFPTYNLWQDALELSHELDHPVYDCMYLVLAQREGAKLLTLDKTLKTARNEDWH